MRRKIQEGLEFGPNATWTDYPKTKLLFMAASSDNLGLAEEVLENKRVDVNSWGSSENRTPLHVACHRGSQRVAKLLLSRGAVFNPRDRQGRTAEKQEVALNLIKCSPLVGKLDLILGSLVTTWRVRLPSLKAHGAFCAPTAFSAQQSAVP